MDETVVTSFDSIEQENEKKPYLTFIWGPRMGELVLLEKNEITVGRSPDCDLWIEDGAISRKHFCLQIAGKGVSLKDTGSTNGTLVNGEKVSEKKLSDGDKIQISRDTILEFSYLDETQSLSEKKRYEMGVMDPVTNTHNKRYFLDRIREEFSFAKRSQRHLSIILFDIDHFKKINDGYGHLAGDFVLQKLGAYVSKIIRTHDIFCRYGGEEFVILMRDTECQNAVNLAERIRKIIEQSEFVYEEKKLPVTISCGISSLHEGLKDYQALIAEADTYLYQSKEGGRNRISGACVPTV